MPSLHYQIMETENAFPASFIPIAFCDYKAAPHCTAGTYERIIGSTKRG
jgi:hypothetical protein